MFRLAKHVIALAMVLCFITSPASGNWFGKRGDKPDLFSLLLQRQSQMPATKRSDLDQLTAYSGQTDKLSALALLASIDNTIQGWKQQSLLGDKAIQQ